MIPQHLIDSYKLGRITRPKMAKMAGVPLPNVIAELKTLGLPQPECRSKEERNREIYERFQAGTPILQLKEEYYMSEESVRRILIDENKRKGGSLRLEPRYMTPKAIKPGFYISDEDRGAYLDGKIGLDTIANKYKKSLREVHAAARLQGLPLRHLVHKMPEGQYNPSPPKEKKPLPSYEKEKRREIKPRVTIPIYPKIHQTPKQEPPKETKKKPPKHKSLLPRKSLTDKELQRKQRLQILRTLNEPEPAKPKSPFAARNLDIFHRVQAGESLSSIASLYLISKERVRQIFEQEEKRLNGLPYDKLKDVQRPHIFDAVNDLIPLIESKTWFRGVQGGVYQNHLVIEVLCSKPVVKPFHKRLFDKKGWQNYPVVLRHFKSRKLLTVFQPFHITLCYFCEDEAALGTKGLVRYAGKACCVDCYNELVHGQIVPMKQTWILPRRQKKLKPKKDDVPPSWDNIVRLWEDEQCVLS